MANPYDLTPAELGRLRALAYGDFTAATLPAATTVPLGVMVRITDLGYSLWRTRADFDGVVRWAPVVPTKLFESVNLVTGTQTTPEQLLKSATVKKGLLGRRTFRIVATFGKSGTTDATAGTQFRIGTAADLSGASIMNITTLLGAANRSEQVKREFRFSTATSVYREGPGATGLQGQEWVANTAAIASSPATTVDVDANDVIVVASSGMATATADSPQIEHWYLETLP